MQSINDQRFRCGFSPIRRPDRELAYARKNASLRNGVKTSSNPLQNGTL